MCCLLGESEDRTEEGVTSYWSQSQVNLLQASVKVSRCPRHDGFDKERLLTVTLLVASDNTEAPALVVGLVQDNVTTPMHVTTTRGRFFSL